MWPGRWRRSAGIRRALDAGEDGPGRVGQHRERADVGDVRGRHVHLRTLGLGRRDGGLDVLDLTVAHDVGRRVACLGRHCHTAGDAGLAGLDDRVGAGLTHGLIDGGPADELVHELQVGLLVPAHELVPHEFTIAVVGHLTLLVRGRGEGVGRSSAGTGEPVRQHDRTSVLGRQVGCRGPIRDRRWITRPGLISQGVHLHIAEAPAIILHVVHLALQGLDHYLAKVHPGQFLDAAQPARAELACRPRRAGPPRRSFAR